MRTSVPNSSVSSSKSQSSASSAMNSSKEKLATDFQNFVKDAEELLRATADYSGESITAARSKFEERLSELKDDVENVGNYTMAKYRQAAQKTDQLVHQKPWQAIGIAAAVGLIVGYLANRR